MKVGSHTSRLLAALTVGVIALALTEAAASGAGKGGPGKETIHLTAAGQAAARAAVLTQPDLGTAPGWTGGPKKPVLASTLPCRYQPKQSDLVVVGAAESVWQNAALRFDSEAQVLQTPEMVRLDWQRTVLAPQMVPCLRTALSKPLGALGRLVSFRRIDFPAVATYARAYRVVVDVKTSTATVPLMVDLVLVGRGSTEITLTTSAPLANQPVVSAAEIRLAKLLLSRTRA
ncbi:MAG TPA: hypothetical protein VEH55_10555 [Gaiellaceae bacterium]|nr:hypothetical protein [Gaiellaceae bacterium]